VNNPCRRAEIKTMIPAQQGAYFASSFIRKQLLSKKRPTLWAKPQDDMSLIGCGYDAVSVIRTNLLI
jgi:hypothetical protein